MNIFCKKIFVPLLCGTLFWSACSDDAPSGEDSGQQTYSLVVKSVTASGEDSFGELREVSESLLRERIPSGNCVRYRFFSSVAAAYIGRNC